MFTGIIESVGHIASSSNGHQGMKLTIASGGLDMHGVQLGDSIAVNGVCLTVTGFTNSDFSADVSAESLRYTRFSKMSIGSRVNLEKALTLSKPLGGHLVSGHVDGLGSIVEISSEGESLRYTIACDHDLHRYIANKGSITVDGVSLTVTGLVKGGFTLNIVPHTAENTIIPEYKAGRQVHLEVDLMARYAERLLQSDRSQADGTNKAQTSRLDKSFLLANGYKI